jgi:hypothetical protein
MEEWLMDDELEGIWKEVVVAWSTTQPLVWTTEENREAPQSE